MKRKKWAELEELTLLSKYSDLLGSGILSKLKTREKKFRPIADHVNSVHHLQDPTTFPFKWSWRDVSIKVQNMRHQYLGVKQKIRISKDEFNWKDGENHWENFLKYKEVFGDVELEVKGKKGIDNGSGSGGGSGGDLFEDCCDLGFGIDCDEFEEELEEEDGDGEENVGSEGEFVGEREFGDLGLLQARKFRKGFGSSKGFGIIANQLLELRDVVVRREEKRRERDFVREEEEIRRDEKRRELELRKENRQIEREERLEDRETALEERELSWARREVERRMRLEKELNEERARRRRMEEKREEKEMKWRERLIGLQIEHEKAIMQMHAEASQNQMQILGVMARLFCQFFGSANDGLGPLPPQVLQNLQHPGGLSDDGKPDTNSPSEFM